MNSFKNKLSLVTIALSATLLTKAQYPEVPQEDLRRSDSLLRAARMHSDSAWNIAYPIIQE